VEDAAELAGYLAPTCNARAAAAAGAYTRSLFSSTLAVSDTYKNTIHTLHTLNTP